MGILLAVDRAVLIRYCRAWAEWVEIDAQLSETGRVVRGARGGLVRNPLWPLRKDVEQVVTELGRQLGLSPVARLRSGIKHEPPDRDAEPEGVDELAQARTRLAKQG